MRLEANFERSAFAPEDCPRWQRAEVALAGRSNVGKSSMLNALAGRRGLARISRTPGRTRCLNFFTVGQGLALVDLPGYGFAKLAQEQAVRLGLLLDRYLLERRNLVALVMLIDARRGPEKEELKLAERMRAREAALIVAATKADKLKRSERAAALRRFEPLSVAPLMCSALNGEGIDALRRTILNFKHAGPR